MEWKSDKSNELDRLFFTRMRNQSIEMNPCCNSPEIHLYAHKWDDNFSSGWIWCSNCKNYSHIDGIGVSSDWSNLESIDDNMLCAVPDYLEQNKANIDKFMNKAIGIHQME